MSANIEPPLFGAVERRLFRATAVLFAIVALVLLIGGVVWILGQALSFFYNIILPLFMAIIGGLVFLLAPIVSRQIRLFMELAPGILAGWQDYLSIPFPTLTRIVVESAQDGKLKEMVPDMEDSGETVKSYAGLLVGLSFVPLMLFFFLLSGDRLRDHAKELLSVFSARTQQTIMHFIDVFVRQVTGFFQGQLVKEASRCSP